MDGRKRRQDGGAPNTNGGFKKHKQEMESSGIGSKSKPCTKFFSTSGCPFGESCHFLHHVPGGYKAVSQMMNLPPSTNVGPSPMGPPNGGAATVKTRMCKKFISGEGCKFGDKCNYAHAEWELNKPVAPPFEDHYPMGPPMPARYGGRNGPPGLSAGFGESENATVKIGVDSSLVGPIIGKGGVNSKQISRQTGVKLHIRDHESNASLKNIELQGTFDQIKIATAMVRDLVSSVSSSAQTRGRGHGHGHSQGHGQGQGQGQGHGGPGSGRPAHGPASNTYKTKLCENFTKGTCTFGDKCHFAHGASELRKSEV
ncbi:zinc finger CCCH domain-containing protein 14-like [Silene latifolia]|uniref:zinc finger CCCH domain-containing protein 14-like n=1 Tax=Silene latifolia TaxID=37657 RepID=UPI003D779AE0